MARHRDDLDEARFVDAVSGFLASGDFDLVVAGDGIRSGMHAIASFLGTAGGLMARFALVEFQVWHDHAGTTIILPFIPCRTQVIEHRVLIGADGGPLTVETAADERADDLPDHDPERRGGARSTGLSGITSSPASDLLIPIRRRRATAAATGCAYRCPTYPCA